MLSFLLGKLLKPKATMAETQDSTKEIIILDQYLTSNGRYPDRLNSPECTQEVKDAAVALLERVNKLLNGLGIDKVDVTSGFRTSASNAKIPGAAKASNHMRGAAVDILDDKNQSLCKKVTKDILIKYDLYREDSDSTKGVHTNWIHLQTTPTKSGSRIFIP